ncbi:MAG: ferredoxin [Gemmatimonadota bacterium]
MGRERADEGDARSSRQVEGLRIRIDRTLCVGFGDCLTTAPEAFELDEEGMAVFREPEAVPRWRLLEACAACPVDALSVEDEDGKQILP